MPRTWLVRLANEARGVMGMLTGEQLVALVLLCAKQVSAHSCMPAC